MWQNLLPRQRPIAGNPAMLNRRKITLRTDAERAAARAVREDRERLEREEMLASLDDWEWETGEQGGKPPIVLPPEIARRVLADVDTGHSYCAIERKYANTPRKFSRRWLCRAIDDGSLQRMAGLGHLVGQNPAQNGNGPHEYEYVKAS